MNPTLYNRLRQASRSGERSWRPPLRPWQKITGLASCVQAPAQGPQLISAGIKPPIQPAMAEVVVEAVSGFGSGIPPVSVPTESVLAANSAASELEASRRSIDRKESGAITVANPVANPAKPSVLLAPGPASPPPSSIHKGVALLIWMVVVLLDGVVAAVALAHSWREAWRMANANSRARSATPHPGLPNRLQAGLTTS